MLKGDEEGECSNIQYWIRFERSVMVQRGSEKGIQSQIHRNPLVYMKRNDSHANCFRMPVNC